MSDTGYQTPAPQVTPTGPQTAPTGGGGAGNQAALLPQGMGNQAASDALTQAPPAGPGGAVGDQLPADLALKSAGVSFQLPANTILTGDWKYDLRTQGATRVWITVTEQGLSVQFWPALQVDATWPVSNADWRSVDFSFTKGEVSHVGVESTQFALPVEGTVRSSVTDFVHGVMAPTPMGRAGYNPLRDRNLAGTLAAVQSSFLSKGSSGGGKGNLDPAKVGGVALSASFKTRSRIEQGTSQGGLVLPAGAGLDVSVSVAGNMPTLARGGVPDVQSIDIGSSDLTLLKDGKPIAKLRSLRIARGGAVDVLDFEPLGKLAEYGAGESLIRLFAVLAQVRGAGDARVAQNADIHPRVVNGVAELEMERALTAAVQEMVREHHDAIPGVDLRSVLGVDPKGRSTAGPKM